MVPITKQLLIMIRFQFPSITFFLNVVWLIKKYTFNVSEYNKSIIICMSSSIQGQ